MKIKLTGGFRQSRTFAFIVLSFSVIIGFVLLFSFFIFRFKPVFEEKAECAAKNKANLILNSAVSSVFDGINTDKFANIITDSDNTVTSISTNTGELNRIKTQIYEKLKEYSKNSGDTTIYIPIGSLTNYPALQGVGYKIPPLAQHSSQRSISCCV